jgi:ComF family protein
MTPFFPNTCIGCGKIAATPLCFHCEQEWMHKHRQVSKYISQKGDEIFTCCQYNGLGGKIIRSFKYGRRFDVLPIISMAVSNVVSEIGEGNFSYIIPVPQSFRKIFTRGFHPVEMIGHQVSQHTSIPINLKILKRKWSWYEKDQASLNKQHRLYNLSHSFYATRNKSWGENQKALLIDDVSTTGTTLNHCKEAIQKQYPDWKVKILVFAHG